MSAYIGTVKGPYHNSPEDSFEVQASRGGVEIVDLIRTEHIGPITSTLDPIAARNFAALLVRASEEVERMQRDQLLSGELPPVPPFAGPQLSPMNTWLCDNHIRAVANAADDHECILCGKARPKA